MAPQEKGLGCDSGDQPGPREQSQKLDYLGQGDGLRPRAGRQLEIPGLRMLEASERQPSLFNWPLLPSSLQTGRQRTLQGAVASEYTGKTAWKLLEDPAAQLS